MKANENEKRRKIREEAKIEALKCIKNKDHENAYKFASRAVRITNAMVTAFIDQCRQHNIQFVCAPYEGTCSCVPHLNFNQAFIIIS